jgi:hypothetical protein
MYTKVSVVTKFYDAKIYKNIYIIACTFYLYSVVLYSLKVQHLHARRTFFLNTETTQKMNKFHVKKYLKI